MGELSRVVGHSTHDPIRCGLPHSIEKTAENIQHDVPDVAGAPVYICLCQEAPAAINISRVSIFAHLAAPTTKPI
jgi:hypothetical protein